MKLILDKPQEENVIYLKDIESTEDEKQYHLFYDSKWLLLETNEGYYKWCDCRDGILLIDDGKDNVASFEEAIDIVKYYFGFGYKSDAFEVFKKDDVELSILNINK